MPTLEISYHDICQLIGKKISLEELKEAMNCAKGEIEAVSGDLLKVEIKDTNRPDLWSAEGIAREIEGRIAGLRGCPRYKVKKSGVVVTVDRRNAKIRPLTVCAVVRDLRLSEAALSQLIQLQEKICGTFGRNRKEVALGVYDLDRIKPPIRFTAVRPDGIKFVPLDFEEELTPEEILGRHPKGREFGHLLAGLKEYPLFIDSAGEVLSLPPIINSNYAGKVSSKTRSVFIECSGFDFRFLVPSLNVVVAALAERGGKIESVKVVYPKKVIHTPDLSPKKARIGVGYVNEVSGLKLTAKEICKLLEMARYDAKPRGKAIELLYPAYRQDIMHPRDIVEDVAISYGYSRIEPAIPKIYTVGAVDKKIALIEKVSEIMVGLGFQEVLSYTLTSKENLFKKMNLEASEVVEIENPISSRWEVFRNSLLPGLLEFLSCNKHVDYPQRIFEVGSVVAIDEEAETRTKDVLRLACCIAQARVSYEEISSLLDGLLSSLGVRYELKATRHPSFIEGRVAEIFVGGRSVGVIGEIFPEVLNSWNLDMPVAAFELEIEPLVSNI